MVGDNFSTSLENLINYIVNKVFHEISLSRKVEAETKVNFLKFLSLNCTYLCINWFYLQLHIYQLLFSELLQEP